MKAKFKAQPLMGQRFKGQLLEATVKEVLSATHVIVSFNGDLAGVQNPNRLPLRVGQKLSLLVVQVKPLRLQLRNQAADSRINRLI